MADKLAFSTIKLSFLRCVTGAKFIISRNFVSDIHLGICAAQSAAGHLSSIALCPGWRDGKKGTNIIISKQ